MMKKYFALLLCVIVITSLAACSNSSNMGKSDSTQVTQSSTVKSTIAPTEKVTEKPTQATTKAPATKAPDKTPKTTTGESNALSKAKSYLRHMAYSYDGLIEQLEYEGFTHSEAVYGADNCGADWYEQAVKKAESYLKNMSFSYDGLVEQLEYEGFTHDQAVHGADKAYNTSGGNSDTDGSAGQQNALSKAKSYLRHMAFSYDGLIEQLEYEGFSHEDAKYAVDNCGADWYDQAAKKAKSYLKNMSFSYDGLIEQLEYEGFTHEQAEYGAAQNGY